MTRTTKTLLPFAALPFTLGLLAGTTSCDKGAKDCAVLEYQARDWSGGLNVAGYGGVNLETSKKAIREVDQGVERYLARWQTACRDFKSEALTREEYRDEIQGIREHMEKLEELTARLQAAQTPEQFEMALRDAHTTAVPEASGSQVGLEFKFLAQRPTESSYSVASQGATLATDTKVFTELALDSTAYVYLYQIDPQGTVQVLFPDPRMSLPNPLAGGQTHRIPNGAEPFRLNEKDLGWEDLHIVASAKPLAALEGNLAALGSGKAVSAQQLECNTRGLEFNPGTECPRTRGLEFNPSPAAANSGAAQPGYSLKAVNAAADDALHMVYSFHHVGAHDDYGTKKRGIEMLKSATAKRPAQMPGNFDACPAGAVAKEMPAAAGGYERFCVETNSAGQLVDHGPYRKWRPTGKLWVTGQVELGRRVGKWQTFNEDGQLLADVDY